MAEAESYREMEARHEAMDAREWRQEWSARWAGNGPDHEVPEPDPAIVHDCTNCRYAEGGVCREGRASCSGWPWDPKDSELEREERY